MTAKGVSNEHEPLLRQAVDDHISSTNKPIDTHANTIVASETVHDEAHRAENAERKLTFRTAVSLYPEAIFWSLFFSLGVIMCAFDAQLMGNLYATPAFRRDFGYRFHDRYIIPASWQTGLNMGSPLGQVVGAFSAAYPMDQYGRKKTFAVCVVLTSMCVAIQFTARSLGVLLIGELVGGLVLGVYVVIAPAYASEVCPVALRGILTGFTNLAFVLGQFLATCVVARTSRLDNHWAYSGPFAVQWIWPAVILLGIPFAPESPWWLQRQGQLDEARIALQKLCSSQVDVEPILAQIIDTDRREREVEQASTYADCFKKTNWRRTQIGTGVYCIQVLSGIYLVSYATYFFQLAGIPTTRSFGLSITFLLLGGLGTLISFSLVTKLPYRTLFLSGLAILSTLQFTIAILDCLPSYESTPMIAYAQAMLMLLWNFVYGGTLGPLTFVILTSVSSTRLRSKTIAFATAMQAMLGIVMSIVIPRMFNPDQINARGKIGFLFGGLAALSWCWSYVQVPELKGKTWSEVDLLFEKGVSAREFSGAFIDDEQ